MTPMQLLFLSYLSEMRFLVDIFKNKRIQDLVIYNCCGEGIAVATQRMFSKYNIKSAHNMLYNNISVNIPVSRSKVGIVVDSSCKGWKHIFDCSDSRLNFQNPFVWVFVTKDLNSTIQELSHYQIEIDSDATIAHNTQNGYDIYEIYNTGFYKNGVFKTVYIGNWISSLNIEKVRKRNDLSGVVLTCTVVILEELEAETFEHYLMQENHVGFDSLHKLKYITILKYLKDMYNMTYNLQRTNSWGYIRNGSFDGMVGALQRQETDIGGSPIFFRADRNKIIDYTAEVWHSRHSFIFRHPKHPSGFYTIYTRPLSTVVWFSILAVLLFSAFVLYTMFKLSLRRSSTDSSLSLALVFLWGALCQQGASLSQQTSSMKILIFSTFVYSAILYQYYTASVVSTLLMEAPKNIKTLKDLLESNLKVGVEEALYDRDYFKRTTDPVALEIYRTKVKHGCTENFFTPEEGMALVKRGGFAFHVDTIVSYGIVKNTFSEREVCEIQDVPMYAPHRLGAVMKKHSPYRDHLSYGIRKIMESGLMYRIRWAWDEPRPACVKTPDSSIYSVSILEFSTPLIILLFGYGVSFLVLILEIVLYCITNRQINKFDVRFKN